MSGGVSFPICSMPYGKSPACNGALHFIHEHDIIEALLAFLGPISSKIWQGGSRNLKNLILGTVPTRRISCKRGDPEGKMDKGELDLFLNPNTLAADRILYRIKQSNNVWPNIWPKQFRLLTPYRYIGLYRYFGQNRTVLVNSWSFWHFGQNKLILIIVWLILWGPKQSLLA